MNNPHGNLAGNYPYRQSYNSQPNQDDKDDQRRAKILEKRKQHQRRVKLFARSSFIAILTLVGTSIFLFNFFEISDQKKNIADMNQKIQVAEDNIVKKQVEISAMVDLNMVEQAATQMGMRRPDQSQIQYIELPATDQVQVTPKQNKFYPFFNNIRAGILTILEYLS